MGSTYNGKMIRVSNKNHKILDLIKRKRRYKNYDSVISKLLRDSKAFKKPSRKRKMKGPLFNSKDFGL